MGSLVAARRMQEQQNSVCLSHGKGQKNEAGFSARATLGVVQVEAGKVLVFGCSTTAGLRGTKMAHEHCLQSVERRNGFWVDNAMGLGTRLGLSISF